MNPPKFQIGDLVRKTKGSQWSGTVVGTYSTELTPEGYAVESSTEKGSVQIYPAAALEGVNPTPVESLKEEVERLRKASAPICIGQPLIQILAAEGKWISMDGRSLIAASCLFRKDPYIELEQAWQEVAVLRQDNEHHVNRCYAAEKARNEALDEVERLKEQYSQQPAHDDHMQQLQEYFQQNSMLKVYPEKPEASCCSKETISSAELESLRRKVAAASHLEFALQLVKRFAETCHCQCGKKMSDTDLPLFYTQALAWWKEANK